MKNEKFSEDNIDSIQQYVAESMTTAEKNDFEKVLEEDEDLQKLVDHYRMMQEGFELNELEQKRQRLKNIKSLATQELEVPIQNIKAEQDTPVVSLRRMLSYAAMLIPGLFMGWLFFGSPKPSTTGEQYTGNQGTKPPVEQYGGDTEDYIMLYEGESPLLKVFQEAKEEVIFSKVEKRQINLLVSEMAQPSLTYTLEEDLLEISLPKDMIKEDNLENANIQLIVQKLQSPNLKVALLKINQRTVQIPFSDEDFNKLFN